MFEEELLEKIEQTLLVCRKINFKIVKTLKLAVQFEEHLRRELHTFRSLCDEAIQKDIANEVMIQNWKTEESSIQEKIKIASSLILQLSKEEWLQSLDLNELIQGQEQDYFRHGVFEIVRNLGNKKEILTKLLKKIIPAHPKDEYEETRLLKRTFYIHAGPTNSGKTYSALEALKNSKNGIYLAPLRLLALEIYEKLNQSSVRCNLRTGEEEIIIEGAKHEACTVEKANVSRFYDIAVIDECQMIGDHFRGYAWTKAILGIQSPEIHLCCAPHAIPLLKQLIADCEDDCVVVDHQRQVPLIVEEDEFSFPHDVKKNDALIVFSKKTAIRVAAMLYEHGISASVIYGNLPPETRKKQVELFLTHQTQVIVSTDAIGMGLNLPIERVVFIESQKFDGSEVRDLVAQEIKQIAGRAGRKGIYETGYVNTVLDKRKMYKKMESDDAPLEIAYVLPFKQTLIDLPFGTLKERLHSWMDHQYEYAYFEKNDITHMLDLLEESSDYHEKIPMDLLYQAITIPFNYLEDELLEYWLEGVATIANKKLMFRKPNLFGMDLASLENYYRNIDLYYSFSKTFSLEFDLEWVKEQREFVSEKIHSVLIESIKNNLKIRQVK
jgi:ATP-dependent RNA helicase SUPV3L1/SUV3